MRGKRDNHFVSQVRWASLCERPSCIPVQKPSQVRGAKAAGLRYERLFAKQFPQSLHGQWFEYEDRDGHGYCQPDLIVSLLPKCIIVFEVKYTLTPEAYLQLTQLYLPVVQAAMSAPVIGCIVVRNLASSIASGFFVTADLDAAIEKAMFEIPVLHWIGQSVVRHPHHLKFKPQDSAFQSRFPARHQDVTI